MALSYSQKWLQSILISNKRKIDDNPEFRCGGEWPVDYAFAPLSNSKQRAILYCKHKNVNEYPVGILDYTYNSEQGLSEKESFPKWMVDIVINKIEAKSYLFMTYTLCAFLEKLVPEGNWGLDRVIFPIRISLDLEGMGPLALLACCDGMNNGEIEMKNHLRLVRYVVPEDEFMYDFVTNVLPGNAPYLDSCCKLAEEVLTTNGYAGVEVKNLGVGSHFSFGQRQFFWVEKIQDIGNPDDLAYVIKLHKWFPAANEVEKFPATCAAMAMAVKKFSEMPGFGDKTCRVYHQIPKRLFSLFVFALGLATKRKVIHGFSIDSERVISFPEKISEGSDTEGSGNEATDTEEFEDSEESEVYYGK